MSFEIGRDILISLRKHGTPRLGASIDILERLAARQVEGSEVHRVIERLPMLARIAMAVAGQPGAHDELGRVARQLEAKFASMCELQARRSFEVFGDALGAKSFKDYLNGTDALEGVMEVPEFPGSYMACFDETVLVDGRLFEEHEKSIGIAGACGLAEVLYMESASPPLFIPFEPERKRTGLYWMRFQDGRRNRNLTPEAACTAFEAFEVGADIKEGVCRWIQDNYVLWRYAMDLPGSVLARNPRCIACLQINEHGDPEIANSYGDDDDVATPYYGVASRGE